MGISFIAKPFSRQAVLAKAKSSALHIICGLVFVFAISSVFQGCSSANRGELKLSEKTAVALLDQSKQLRAEGNTAEADAKAKEAADHYARIGELLLMPEGAEYANEMFDKALAIDANNSKALFYKAGLGPLLAARGFIPRIERLVTDKRVLEGIERLREDIRDLKMPEVTKFANQLPAGERPLLTYHDVQRFMREAYLPIILKSIENLNRIDLSKPLELYFTPERVLPDPRRSSGSYSYYSSSCYNDPETGWNCHGAGYSNSWDTPKQRNYYLADQHDLKIVKSAFLAAAAKIRLGTAYSFKDSEYVIRRLQAIDSMRRHSGRRLSPQDTVEIIRSFPEFLVLESDHQLPEIAGSIADALRYGLELASTRSELCSRDNPRYETAIFRSICVTADTADTLQLGLDLLAGPREITLGKNRLGDPIRILIDISRVLKHPTRDLKDLLPISFDADGDVVNYPDPTMGGLFPNGDFIDKMREIGDRGASERVFNQSTKVIRRLKARVN